MPLKAGSAFSKTGTGGYGNPGGGHLCVCLSSACDKGDLLLVTIQTYRPGYDTSCILDVGDHAFVKHKSVATFSRACKVCAAATETMITNGTYSEMTPVSGAILTRLRTGLRASGDTPQFVLDYAKKRGF